MRLTKKVLLKTCFIAIYNLVVFWLTSRYKIFGKFVVEAYHSDKICIVVTRIATSHLSRFVGSLGFNELSVVVNIEVTVGKLGSEVARWCYAFLLVVDIVI